ncbi:ATP-dependent DNA ligase [Bradyrhizobium sp. CCGUVB14]|uniref:ATP-dependent DNA ligase n=1 Tax=Bradyrhizobium sp. CCGUVB14 TaxID=2949628 RepID=UPI00273A5D12|nr:ATP-dependent DNA ligase [Bradyrhizobium sp. CCGUVB14]
MEARSVDAIPTGENWLYEPKWDGFRCLLMREGKQVDLHSKSGQNLNRYFPEVIAGALTIRANSFVLDGEIVISIGGQFSFDALLQRIHPAASRVKKLAAETPALFLAFDLLQSGRDLTGAPLVKRRPLLESFAARFFSESNLFRLSPASTKLRDAQRWLVAAGGGSDGVISKRLDLPYQAGNREGMQKIKRYRSADCVIGGFRYGVGRRVVGSILLGLYDDEGLLQHVGFSSGTASSRRHLWASEPTQPTRLAPHFRTRAKIMSPILDIGNAEQQVNAQPELTVPTAFSLSGTVTLTAWPCLMAREAAVTAAS